MNQALMILLISFMAGCTSLIPKTTGALVKGVEHYCDTVSTQGRMAIRGQVNSELAARASNKEDPPQVKGVYCPGDAK